MFVSVPLQEFAWDDITKNFVQWGFSEKKKKKDLALCRAQYVFLRALCFARPVSKHYRWSNVWMQRLDLLSSLSQKSTLSYEGKASVLAALHDKCPKILTSADVDKKFAYSPSNKNNSY